MPFSVSRATLIHACRSSAVIPLGATRTRHASNSDSPCLADTGLKRSEWLVVAGVEHCEGCCRVANS
jgi:hypothetical protein